MRDVLAGQVRERDKHPGQADDVHLRTQGKRCRHNRTAAFPLQCDSDTHTITEHDQQQVCLHTTPAPCPCVSCPGGAHPVDSTARQRGVAGRDLGMGAWHHGAASAQKGALHNGADPADVRLYCAAWAGVACCVERTVTEGRTRGA